MVRSDRPVERDSTKKRIPVRREEEGEEAGLSLQGSGARFSIPCIDTELLIFQSLLDL